MDNKFKTRSILIFCDNKKCQVCAQCFLNKSQKLYGFTKDNSRISAKHKEVVVDKLWRQCNHLSTTNKYLDILRISNQFIIKLDQKPRTWEDRLTLFCAYLVDLKGFCAYLVDLKGQSATIKLYVSAIKWVLKSDGYCWNQNKLD